MYRNSEGYADPTAGGAFVSIAKEERRQKVQKDAEVYRPLVYICSPYRGDVETNTENARKYCRYAIESTAIPIAPHLLYPQFMNDDNPEERYLALHKINYVLVGKCQELWVFGNKVSHGMAREIALAERRKKIIRYFNADCEEITDERSDADASQ